MYEQNTIEKWTKGCTLFLPKKGDLRITKNYWGITLTAIVARVYNALLLNCIGPEVEKILRKNPNGFWRNQSTTLQILTIHWSVERVHAKKSQGNSIAWRFLQSIWFYTQGKDGTNTTCIWSPQSNFYHNNDVLQKHKRNDLLTWW